MNKVSNGLDFRQDYCQFLIVSQKNFTQTYFAEHTKRYTHDQINRYLKSDHISSADIWTEAKAHIIPSNKGYLLFDDTVIALYTTNFIGPLSYQAFSFLKLRALS